jgi:hypothetical protein
MLLIEKKERQIKSFIKARMDELYSTTKRQSIGKLPIFKYLNVHFSQFTASYDKESSEYCILNHLGNGCRFILGKTYVSKYDQSNHIKTNQR